VILREFIGAMKNPFRGPKLLSFWISFSFGFLDLTPFLGREAIVTRK
jgi:hypothetical protein